MIIEIEPLDTLFFRDGKPFSMGEEVWANGIFPPPPSVIYGALRSAYFANNINQINQANTADDPTNSLEIKGIYYRLENEDYLPVPLDLVHRKSTNKDEQTYKLVSLVYFQDKGFCSSLDMPAILKYDEEVEAIEDGIIESSRFNTYIKGCMENLECKCRRLSDLIKREPKIGIGRNNSTHSADEGKIYRVEMRRLKGLKIIVEFEGIDIDTKGFLKLGGEGKTAFYQETEEKIVIDNPEITGNRFKLYLSTPAIFKDGWLPAWLKSEPNLKLLTAAIGKPASIGGFDIKAKKPKTMQKAVPAGSVYYFEFEGDNKEIIEKFHKKSISDFKGKEGFGISLVGDVK